MKISVSIDAENLKTKTNKEAKNLAYSTAQALNDTAKDVQYKIQGDVQQLFHLRKKPGSKSWEGATSAFAEATGDQPSRSERSWIVRQIAVLAWANVKLGRIFAEVGIRKRERFLLPLFTTGGMREPFVGKNVAVPVTKYTRKGGMIIGPIETAKTFKALKFKTTRTRAGKKQIKGKNRSFILRSTATHQQGGVYQRVGPARDDIHMLYSFRRAFRLRAVFRFIKRAEQTYAERFKENFYRRFYKLQK